ncbi:MAG: DNA helicase II / ATP-dependent DNA helicase PcrA [Candidatus Berkelbacteria bacterium Licking1014_7]|uniref:DNA 3'-5' helicase n=1 Tax=Candidatus Berkelbacteria bacterium Licking1014_7 TaxID=2017147 RepID=A0A554LK81_9BACT|nr:MAG: DNA helicase II / ATP-dependent DNA helicase PcrA [Candidatus Berkelbacteria bacterium Licking1014_7]
MNPILNELNPVQQQAAQIKDGPILILAGAGSGKTKTLTHRIAYLIKHHNIPARNILAVTFTNKAAEEMQTRINRILPQSNSLAWMGTFHSICVKILRRELNKTNLGFTSNFTIFDDQDQLSIIKKILKELSLDPPKINPRAVRAFIENAKNEAQTADEMEKFSRGEFQKIANQIYHLYEKYLKSQNGLDFDDLLIKTVALFNLYPEILKKYQNIFCYILVDEYQDTNQIQYQLIKLLARQHLNLCAIGDDSQSIYQFRGADFRNILNFEKDYPNVQVIKLEQNYRSTKNILKAAQDIIEKNLHRTDKTLWTQNPKGAPITLAGLEDEQEEALFIISEIKSLRQTGVKPSDCVVLYRTHAQSRAIEEQLIKTNLGYKIIGGVSFYQRSEIKDILAYVKLLANPHSRISLERIAGKPPRGIGAQTLIKGGKKLNDFLKLMENIRLISREKKPAEIIDLVARRTGYKDWLLENSPEAESRWENIKELKTVAQEYDNLADFLEKTALHQPTDQIEDEAEKIHLMTFHNVKGLEYPIVFMVGMEEGLFPHSRSLLEPQELEEERRLCYVGITRAKKRLYLTHAQSRRFFGSFQSNPASRFLDELPNDILDII